MANKKKNQHKKNNPGQKMNINTNPKYSIKQMLANSKRLDSSVNSTFYKKNLDSLKNKDPELAEKVDKTKVVNYQLVPSGQGKALNLSIKNQNRTYYDRTAPLDDVKKQLENLKLKNNRLAVFLGMGLGYELLYYLQNIAKQQKTIHYLVIEKNLEIFKTAMQVMDLRLALENKNIQFMVGLPEETLYVYLRKYLKGKNRFKYLKAMKPVYHQSALALDKEYYLRALKNLRESGTHEILNYGNCPEDSLIGVENMLENINEIAFNPGINLLLNKFKCKPAVVIATGPSLNKNKHLLKGLEDKALLVAADASLKIMLEMDVKPHLVTSLERVPATAELFNDIRADQVGDVYLAGCPVVRNEVYQNYPGPRVIVYRDFDHFKWLNIDRGILDIKLSSGNMAFKVAAALGCDPIILIGQDLAYGSEGITHARGAVLGEIQGKGKKRKTLTVKGNNGQSILTTNTWYSFLKAYELDVAEFEGTCINSTEGGAYIEGTDVMTFQQAIDQYIDEPYFPLENIKNHLASFDPEMARNDFGNIQDLIKKTIADMQNIIEKCEQGLNLYEKHKNYLSHIISSSENLPAYDKLEAIAEEILKPKRSCAQEHYHTFQLFFMHILQSFNIRFEMEMLSVPEKYNNDTQAYAETLLRSSEWYSVVKDLAQVCLNLLYKSARKIENKKPMNNKNQHVCL